MMSISNKVTMVARRAVLSSGTGSLRAAVTQRRRRNAPSAFCFPFSLTLQAFSERPVVRSRQVVVYDSKAMRAATSCVSARTRLMVEIQDAGRKIAVVKAARESVQKVRAELMNLLMATVKKRMRFNCQDKVAMADYTGRGYDTMNNALRSRLVKSSLQERINAVVKAMTKPKFKVYRGTVYRGTALSTVDALGLRPGATYCDPAFLSSSWRKMKAAKFTAKTKMGSVSVLFQIQSKTGVGISQASMFPGEAEVLFRPSTLFKIISVVCDEKTGRKHVALEEIA
jgi:hypothetical protein